MNIDIKNLFQDMASTASNNLQQDGDKISGNLLKVLENNKDSIAELVKARADGDINQEDFDSELAREKSILEVEMLGLEIASKAAIQKAVNAAINTLTSAVSAAL